MSCVSEYMYICMYIYITFPPVCLFRSLEGILDDLRSDRQVDGVLLDNMAQDSDDEDSDRKLLPGSNGSSRLNDGSRTVRPEIVTSALKFSPTGREWAVASTQGLQIFALDSAMMFAPTDLDVAITPQTIGAAIMRQEFSLALNMALHLGEAKLLKKAVDAVEVQAIELVIKTVDVRMIKDLMKFLADELVSSKHTEYYLQWCWEIIRAYGQLLQSDSMPYMESLRALIRVVSNYEKEIMKMTDDNQFSLAFINSQMKHA